MPVAPNNLNASDHPSPGFKSWLRQLLMIRSPLVSSRDGRGQPGEEDRARARVYKWMNEASKNTSGQDSKTARSRDKSAFSCLSFAFRLAALSIPARSWFILMILASTWLFVAISITDLTTGFWFPMRQHSRKRLNDDIPSIIRFKQTH